MIDSATDSIGTATLIPVGDLPQSADIVVVGGGIVGTAIAWHLSRRGAKVVLVERAFLASGASGANLGLLLASSLTPGPLLGLAQHSLEQYARAGRDLGREIEFVRRGSLEVIWTSADRCARQQLADLQRAAGLAIELLDPEAARRREPSLPHGIAGAAFAADDASVNPFAAVTAFAAAAARCGARIAPRTCVTDIDTRGGRVRAVETTRGNIATGTVIDAAGAHASAIAELAGVAVPITPVHGQAFVTVPTPPRFGLIVRGLDPFVASVNGDNIAIGATADRVGWTGRTTPNGIRTLARLATQRLPRTATLPVLRVWSGLRPASPDGLPLAGETECAGFFVASGTYKQGMMLGPALAEVVACLVLHEPPPLDPTPFHPNRFAPGGVAARTAEG